MDYEQQLESYQKQLADLSRKYQVHRMAFGKEKSDLDIIYAANIKSINEIKKNSGYETGLILLMALKPELRESYKLMVTSLHNYKALQRLIDAVSSNIMTIQSRMRFNRSNDGQS